MAAISSSPSTAASPATVTLAVPSWPSSSSSTNGSYDIPAARAAELLKLFNKQAAISRTLGLTLSFDSNGDACMTWPFNASLSQAGGNVHGGMHAIMLDTVCWFQAASRHGQGYWPLTSDLNLHYLRATGRSSVTARARIIKGSPVGSRAAQVVEAYTFDDHGNAVTHAIGTYVLPQSKL